MTLKLEYIKISLVAYHELASKLEALGVNPDETITLDRIAEHLLESLESVK